MNPHIANDADSDPLDRILADDEELMPSSGFLASVMERVQEEAQAPAPIPFPWRRAIPGIVLVAGVFGWAAIEFTCLAIPAMRTMSLTQPDFTLNLSHPVQEAGWVAFALIISLASWLLSRRLTGEHGLL